MIKADVLLTGEYITTNTKKIVIPMFDNQTTIVGSIWLIDRESNSTR